MTIDNLLTQLIFWQNKDTPIEKRVAYIKKEIDKLIIEAFDNGYKLGKKHGEEI